MYLRLSDQHHDKLLHGSLPIYKTYGTILFWFTRRGVNNLSHYRHDIPALLACPEIVQAVSAVSLRAIHCGSYLFLE